LHEGGDSTTALLSSIAISPFRGRRFAQISSHFSFAIVRKCCYPAELVTSVPPRLHMLHP
jgi:hypothetical protein